MHVPQDLFSYKSTSNMLLRIGMSIYNDDRIRGQLSGGYLRRASTVLRGMIGDALRKDRGCKLDRVSNLVLAQTGLMLMSNKKLAKVHLRRVGDYYYTVDFAQSTFQDAILCNGVLGKVHNAALTRATRAGSQLTSLFPQHIETWVSILADVFSSPDVRHLRTSLASECEAHGEFLSLSVDGTRKPSFTLLGQPSGLAPHWQKMEHATPLAEQKYTLLTCLGLSGAVLGMQMVPSEAADTVVGVLADMLTDTQRSLVEHLAVDDPSEALLLRVEALCPNFRAMSLCIVHLAFTYESTNQDKRTPGSVFLRKVLSKISSFRGPRGNTSTLPIYRGDGRLSALEERKVQRIRNQSMRPAIAKRVVDNIDPNTAFRNRGEYMDCLAALTAMFPSEVRKRATSGRMVKDILATSCRPDRLEYMLNEARFTRTLSTRQRELFQSGVCGNEAFHYEVKRVFSNVSMHPSTLELKLGCLQIRKLLAHNSALYRPTLRERDEAGVLACLVPSVTLWGTPSQWAKWCGACGAKPRGKVPALAKARALESQRFRLWNSGKTKKRVKCAKHTKTKRTVFRLRKGLDVQRRQ